MGKKSKGSSVPGESQSKKGKMSLEFSLNPRLSDENTLGKMKKLWTERGESKASASNDDFLFMNVPFPCCQLRNLMDVVPQSLQYLSDELLGLEYTQKSNDLYKFAQSSDLNGVNGSPSIEAFKKFMYGPMLSWMKEATGIKLLDDHIDIFAAQYAHTDYLLCHDDELEGRRIAFIWYLVPSDWNESDGGSLDLYDVVESTGEPRRIVKSLIPVRNSFNFFEVSHLSFHQVREVLAKDKTRLSISGWFRGSSLPGPPRIPSLPLERCSPSDIDEKEFFKWINPSFMNPVTQGDIQETFEDKSEISLNHFLEEEKFSAVKEALLNSDLLWKAQGPPNRRSYDILEAQNTPEILLELLKFMRSDAFFLFLSNVTGIKLHPLFEEESEEEDESVNSQDEESEGSKKNQKEFSPSASYELRRWKKGSYTLIRDTDKRELCLDARLCFNIPPAVWEDEAGGFTSYLAAGEDEELMSVSPEENTLLLVYKDEETLKFVKYINDKFEESSFYDVEVSYFENK